LWPGVFVFPAVVEMTRGARPDVVHLSLENWLGIVAMVVTLVGAAWFFTLDISGHIQSLEARVNAMDQRLNRIDALQDDRLRKIEGGGR
jgi:hypothetical protein